ncbi:hypothetical protein [Clostridium thailandense]|uniref:hypothetical protein n=1 Tax=Clostridium thailandense TaxID=2794346 RepID=UPI003989A75E
MLDRLGKFYLKIPKDILEVSLNEDYNNRQTRRLIKSYKKVETKIKHILKDEILHKMFIEYIYEQYDDVNNFNSNIDKIIESINKDNFVESIIYMSKNFYASNKFKEYVLSDEFSEYLDDDTSLNIIKKESESNSMENNQYNSQNTKKIEQTKNKSKYIVNIQQKNGFYNIYPLAKIQNNKLLEVEKEEYPDYGNINVNPYLEFSKQSYDNVSPLWICEFDKSQLEDNLNKPRFNGDSGVTKFKINGNELIKNKCIYNINEEGMYEIAELTDVYVDMEEWIYKDRIYIKNKPISEKVYINDNNYIYGPFGYKDNNRGGGYYLDKEDNDYIIQKIDIKENELNLSVVEIYNQYDYNNAYTKVVYFSNKENLISESIDTIGNKELVKKLKETISNENIGLSGKEIQEVRKSINAIIDNYLSEERMKRIKTLIEDTKKTDKFIENDLIDIIESLLESEDKKNIIAEKILKNHEILRKLQNVEKVDVEILNKSKELINIKEELKNEKEKLEEIKLEVNSTNKKNKQDLMNEYKAEIQEINDQKEKMKKEIKELTEKYELCEDISSLYTKKETLNKQAEEAEEAYNTFNRIKQRQKEEAEKIEKVIVDKLKNAVDISKYTDIAFDGMIANEMLKSAAEWSKGKYIKNYDNLIASKENIEKNLKVKSFENDNIIDYLYNKISKSRNYNRNEIINIMICLTQGFLTVFAGEPGIGKTSLCNIIANALGIANENSNYNRFIEISVEKGWTSKRDLIGYYNPLTKSFDKNNRDLFKTFNILESEYNKEIIDFPYYILLDEANLSSMEHYWADFMNVCDLDKENRRINLGEDYIYSIPKTLRFLATINYDHTTETLSPRLIDRAWIILLESNSMLIDDYNLTLNCSQEKVSDEIIMFKDMEKCFSYNSIEDHGDELISTVYDVLRDIYAMLKENSISISPRIDIMIKRYLKVGCNLFEGTKDATSEFVALDYAVAQKLLPKINGYSDEYEEFLNNLKKKFDEKNMMKCKKVVESIIEKGNRNMKYYQFFS